jgi:hypothetical protein
MTATQWNTMFETFRTVARAAQAAQNSRRSGVSRT